MQNSVYLSDRDARVVGSLYMTLEQVDLEIGSFCGPMKKTFVTNLSLVHSAQLIKRKKTILSK